MVLRCRPEHLGGVADVALRSLQRPGDEHLFEFAPRVFVEDPLFQEFLYELFELIAHGQRSSRPDSRRNASTYFSRVRRTTSSGSDGTGGCLFQRICFEVVADELLVEARLPVAGLVLGCGPEARRIRRQHFVDEDDVGAGLPMPTNPNSNFVSAMMMPFDSACSQPRR